MDCDFNLLSALVIVQCDVFSKKKLCNLSVEMKATTLGLLQGQCYRSISYRFKWIFLKLSIIWQHNTCTNPKYITYTHFQSKIRIYCEPNFFSFVLNRLGRKIGSYRDKINESLLFLLFEGNWSQNQTRKR